ncbi:hypothetical protein [Segetibacter sp.]|uniref:hypothetical protein n=1 Tax=Segetibacter sp. TaxID=2231182 RepID=UPI0026369AFF|nr:hypothetical protein [Segetibacter sp.]
MPGSLSSTQARKGDLSRTKRVELSPFTSGAVGMPGSLSSTQARKGDPSRTQAVGMPGSLSSTQARKGDPSRTQGASVVVLRNTTESKQAGKGDAAGRNENEKACQLTKLAGLPVVSTLIFHFGHFL